MTDRLIGIAYAANLFHSGQWSRGYRLMSKIRWQPNHSSSYRLKPNSEYETARLWAAYYIRRARKEPNLF